MSKLLCRKIGLTAAQGRALEKKAKRCGVSVGAYVRQVIERDLFVGKSFAEITAPVKADVRKSGMTERQLEEIVAEARHADSKRRRKLTLRKLCEGMTPDKSLPDFDWGGPVGSEIW